MSFAIGTSDSRALPDARMNSSPLEHILICGDTHGRFDHLARAAEIWQARALIFTGDLAPAQALEKELADLPVEGVAGDEGAWRVPVGDALALAHVGGCLLAAAGVVAEGHPVAAAAAEDTVIIVLTTKLVECILLLLA